jgi:hypothetical protein
LKEKSNFKIPIPALLSYIPSFNPFIERGKQYQNPNSCTTELHPFLQSVHKKKNQFQNPNSLSNEIPPFLQSVSLKKESNFKNKIPSALITSLPSIHSLKEESNFQIQILSQINYLPFFKSIHRMKSGILSPNSLIHHQFPHELPPFLPPIHRRK